MSEYEIKPPPRPKDTGTKGKAAKGKRGPGPDAPERAGRHARSAFVHTVLRPLAILAVLFGGIAVLAGTPHIGWNYECRGRAKPDGGCDSYRYCEYYGIQGRRAVFPDEGESCGFVKFVGVDWGALWPAAQTRSEPAEVLERGTGAPTPTLDY